MINSKLPHVGTTIFTVMSKLAKEYQAINLSQGFPNFPVDERLTAILKEVVTENVHQYMPMTGYPPLVQQIVQQIELSYHRSVTSNEILITAGATQGIYTTIQAFVNQGEEVVILDPSYDCYEPAVVMAGGTPKRISLNDDYSPNWEKIEDAFSNQTRMIIVNNPHNPSGRILNHDDFKKLEQLLDKYPNVMLLSDEVYEYITFEKKHISVNSIENLRKKSIIISSFGKTFHITGWKIGYLVAPLELMKEIHKVHQFLVFSVNSIAQVALSKYMEIVNVNELGSFYQNKRDLFRHLVKNSRFELLPSEGTYFQVASYKNISNDSDIDFTQRLVKEFGVATIPMSVFNNDGKDDHLIRFCFAKDEETLRKAAIQLCKI